MAYPFENRERLGMAEKFSELGILAFALGGLGGAGLGFGAVSSPPQLPVPPARLFYIPPPFLDLFPDPWACGRWTIRKAAPGLECVLPPRTHLKPVRSRVLTVMWQPFLGKYLCLQGRQGSGLLVEGL